jgi:ASCH domain
MIWLPPRDSNPPHAEEIIAGRKRSDFRSWRTRHRGVLGIHACKPTAAIIGTVEITDVRKIENGYEWLLSAPRRPKKPTPAKGRLGLWSSTLSFFHRSSNHPFVVDSIEGFVAASLRLP